MDSARATPPILRRTRILVVDDEPEVSRVLARTLEKNGFDAWEVNDPLEAARRSTELRPHLILLDYEMPDLDGSELSVLLKSRNETSTIPIVFLSGSSDDESHDAGAFSGAAGYLDKPVDETKLIQTVRALTRSQVPI